MVLAAHVIRVSASGIGGQHALRHICALCRPVVLPQLNCDACRLSLLQEVPPACATHTDDCRDGRRHCCVNVCGCKATPAAVFEGGVICRIPEVIYIYTMVAAGH